MPPLARTVTVMKLHNRVTTLSGSAIDLPVNQELSALPLQLAGLDFVGPLPQDLSCEDYQFEYTFEVPFKTNLELANLLYPADGPGTRGRNGLPAAGVTGLKEVTGTANGARFTIKGNPQCQLQGVDCMAHHPQVDQLLAAPPLTAADRDYLTDHHMCEDGPSTWLYFGLWPAGASSIQDLAAAGMDSEGLDYMELVFDGSYTEDEDYSRTQVTNPSDGSRWDLYFLFMQD